MGLTLKGTVLRIERAATCRQWICHECHVWRQKELYFSLLLWLGLYFGVAANEKYYGQMSTGWIFACLTLVPRTLRRLGGQLAQRQWQGQSPRVRARGSRQGRQGPVGPARPVLQCPGLPVWAEVRTGRDVCYPHPSARRGTGTEDVLMRLQESLEGRISSPLSSVSAL